MDAALTALDFTAFNLRVVALCHFNPRSQNAIDLDPHNDLLCALSL